MPDWWTGFRGVLEQIGQMPELVALVCLFVINNALWMIHLTRTSTQLGRVLLELVRQLTLLTQEVQELRELGEFQTDLLDR